MLRDEWLCNEAAVNLAAKTAEAFPFRCPAEVAHEVGTFLHRIATVTVKERGDPDDDVDTLYLRLLDQFAEIYWALARLHREDLILNAEPVGRA